MLIQARDYLLQFYEDWINNYHTIEKMAEHNGLTIDQCATLLALAILVANSPHPES